MTFISLISDAFDIEKEREEGQEEGKEEDTESRRSRKREMQIVRYRIQHIFATFPGPVNSD